MKFLILVGVFGFVTADLLQAAAPAVDQSISAFEKGFLRAGSLSRILAIDETWIVQAEKDIQTELEKKLRETFHQMLENIRLNIDHSEELSKDLYDKVTEIRQKLKDLDVDMNSKTKDLISKIKVAAKDALRKFLEKIGSGKRNLDHQMDAMARSKFTDFLELFKEKILSKETLEKIKEYISRIDADHPLSKELKDFIRDMKNTELREILRKLIEQKPGHSVPKGETWNNLKDHFETLDTETKEKCRKIIKWLNKTWSEGADDLRKEYGSIKAVAFQFISQGKSKSAEQAEQALEFFRPYKDDLGILWKQIVDATTEVVGQF